MLIRLIDKIAKRTALRLASWTALAERSGNSAFARTKTGLSAEKPRPYESGVALRFPPQSKMILAAPVLSSPK